MELQSARVYFFEVCLKKFKVTKSKTKLHLLIALPGQPTQFTFFVCQELSIPSSFTVYMGLPVS